MSARTVEPAEPVSRSTPIQPQDLTITMFGAYVHPHDATVWSGGLVKLLGEFGFSVGAARVALARLVRRDLLTRVRQGRLVHYCSTPRLQRLLDEGDRRIFSLGRDANRAELWTVLWHWIPEDLRVQRGRLARRLRFLGFGSVQDATWVSPHRREEEVVELLEDLDLTDYTTVLIGSSARSLDLRRLVERAWDVEGLAERYRAFVDEFTAYRSKAARQTLDDRAAFLLRTRLVHMFRGFPFLDPDLPDDLMSDPRVRSDAVSTFHEVYDALAQPSQRHFDAVTAAKECAEPARTARSPTDQETPLPPTAARREPPSGVDSG